MGIKIKILIEVAKYIKNIVPEPPDPDPGAIALVA